MLVFDWIKQFFGLKTYQEEREIPKDLPKTEEKKELDLSSLTRSQLMTIAKEKGISFKPSIKKQELLEVLK